MTHLHTPKASSRLCSKGPRYSLESSLIVPQSPRDFVCLPLDCSSNCSHACCHVQLMMIASTCDKFIVLGCRAATSLRANRAKFLQTLRSLAALHLAQLSSSGSGAAVVTPQCWPETIAPHLLMRQSSEGNLPATSHRQPLGQAKVVRVQHVLQKWTAVSLATWPLWHCDNIACHSLLTR